VKRGERVALASGMVLASSLVLASGEHDCCRDGAVGMGES